MRVRCGDAQEHAFPKTQAPRHPLWCRGALSLLDLVKQLAVHSDLAAQQIYLRVSSFDQPDKLSNHACAFASKGCESLVLICETSAGSGVTGSLDVLGCCSAQLLLQACNAGSVSSAASFQPLDFLGVGMGVFLSVSRMVEQGSRLDFCSLLRLLCLV